MLTVVEKQKDCRMVEKRLFFVLSEYVQVKQLAILDFHERKLENLMMGHRYKSVN